MSERGRFSHWNQDRRAKAAHQTRDAALTVAVEEAARNGYVMDSYRCGDCRRWHNGGVAARTVKEFVGRENRARRQHGLRPLALAA